MNVKISNKMSVHFITHDEGTNLEKPLYAINYFNTRSDFLYKIYTYLAGYKAIKLGARVLFKGQYAETLIGEEQDARKWLLIVRYPNLTSFISLLKSKYFQFVSILRINTVRKFTFGFVTKKGGPKYIRGKASRASTKDRFYALHHFKMNVKDNDNWVKDFQNINDQSEIQLFFAGQKSVTLEFSQKEKAEIKSPMLMDCIVIWMGMSLKKIKSQVTSSEYKGLCSKSISNHVSIIKREM